MSFGAMMRPCRTRRSQPGIGPPRWTRPRAGNVVAALGAGAYRPCSASDPTGARRRQDPDRSITPAAHLATSNSFCCRSRITRRVPVRLHRRNVGDARARRWRRSAQAEQLRACPDGCQAAGNSVRRAGFGRRYCRRSPSMKISPRSRSRRMAAIADLMTSDSRAGPAIGLTWLPTVSHQAVYDALRTLTGADWCAAFQPSGSVGGGMLERSNGANFKSRMGAQKWKQGIIPVGQMSL